MTNKGKEQAVHVQKVSRFKGKLAQCIDKFKWSHQGVQSAYRDDDDDDDK
jgi:hypothetical protein